MADHAGFPSPAEGYIERSLDLNEFLVPRPSSTFFFRAAGGEILVVDRSLAPRAGKEVIVVLDGELKRKAFSDLLRSRAPVEVWGVITAIIRLL